MNEVQERIATNTPQGQHVKHNRVVRFLGEATDTLILLALFLFFLVGSYVIWDMQQVYDTAEPEKYEQYKPVIPKIEEFKKLQAKNPDVIAWIDIYGTNIDYPVVHADNNQKYLHTSPEGEYSLAGSIFLDYRNHADFRDFNSIIHGHNMAHNVMFGDIADFKDKEFFETHKYGNLYFNEKDHGIEILGYLTADVYTSDLYVPAIVDAAEQNAYIDTIYSQVKYKRSKRLTRSDHILLLSTCMVTATNGRHILVCRLTDETFPNEFLNMDPPPKNEDTVGDYRQDLKIILICIAILTVLLIIAIAMRRNRKRSE